MGALINAFASTWSLLLIRGILGVLFGILAFTWPGLTLETFVLLYALFAMLDGISALFVGMVLRAWGLVVFSVFGFILGLYLAKYPYITDVAALYVIVAWAIVRGIFEIITAILLRKKARNEWMELLGGIISIIFAVVLVVNPRTGALAMRSVIGAYALIFGLMLIILAFRVRELPKRLGQS